MSHDPHAQFDQTVLEMIEHSPVGAVPHTPSYRDALTRLYATHQVYASADHKGGHVTARSLAKLTAFYPENLAALEAGTIDPAALEPNAGIYTRYVRSLSAAQQAKAEDFRTRVVGRPMHHRHRHHGAADAVQVHDLVHTLVLVPGAGPHPGLPGNYLHAALFETAENVWSVHIHDSDDGAMLFDGLTLKDGLAKVHELLDCAPFKLAELEALGFRSN